MSREPPSTRDVADGPANPAAARRMFSWLNRLFVRSSGATVIATALGSLAIVGLLDWLTGYQISFSLFYLVPVSVAAWYAGRGAGTMFSIGASIVWYVVELGSSYPYDHALIPIWNALVRLGFFLIVASLLVALRRRLVQEQRLARTDPLTGVLNARAFEERLERDLALCNRTGVPLTLAYIDLDNFKRVNDTYGHSGGDELLRTIGRTLSEGTRRTDTVARLGGDEFAMILPGADLEGADTLVAELRGLIACASEPGAPSATCSIGAVVFRELPASADAAIAAADGLMYEAKSRGKDGALFGVYAGSGVEHVAPASTRSGSAVRRTPRRN